MRKVMFLTLIFLLAHVPHVFAEGFVPLAGIPGLTQGATADTAGLANFFNNLYKYLIGLAATLAVIEIIWGGLEISTKDSVSKQSDGRERIQQALFGLVLVLSPVLVFSIINPSILNLSLNLDKLDTAGKTSGPNVATSTGKGPECGSVGDVTGSGRCTTVIFDEGSYSTPPSGAYCYQMAKPDAGKPFLCFRSAGGCDDVRRTSCGYSSEQVGCPAAQESRNPCTRAP
jgi:type IV secretory pathway VirB2 component (pilin)